MFLNNNNNQKVVLLSAAARLAQLPLVRSACAGLSVLYTDTKRSHPGLTSVCDVLESSVTAARVTVTPVIEKLEPHISIANAVACRSLDWLEASFPVLLAPTDEIVASAKNKLHDIQAAVQHGLMWVTTGKHDGAKLSLVERAVSVADVSLDSALNFSETLLDQVFPPEEDEGADKSSVEGFEAAKVQKCYPERVVTLAVKLCRRTYSVVGAKVQSAQINGGLPSPPALMQVPQASCLTWMRKLRGLPEYLQRQALDVTCFVFHMYHLIFSAQQVQSKARSHLNAETPSPASNPVRGRGPPPTAPRPRHTRLSTTEDGCNFERRLNH